MCTKTPETHYQYHYLTIRQARKLADELNRMATKLEKEQP